MKNTTKVIVTSIFEELTIDRKATLDLTTGEVTQLSKIVSMEILDSEFDGYSKNRVEKELEFFSWDRDEVYSLDYSQNCLLECDFGAKYDLSVDMRDIHLFVA
jgi:hypothetical protein